MFYWDCTRYLGLGDFGEGKAMGLAAWGDARVMASQAQTMLSSGDGWYCYRQKPSPELLGFGPRQDEPALDPQYTNLAAAMQRALEDAWHSVVGTATRQAGSRRL